MKKVGLTVLSIIIILIVLMVIFSFVRQDYYKDNVNDLVTIFNNDDYQIDIYYLNYYWNAKYFGDNHIEYKYITGVILYNKKKSDNKIIVKKLDFNHYYKNKKIDYLGIIPDSSENKERGFSKEINKNITDALKIRNEIPKATDEGEGRLGYYYIFPDLKNKYKNITVKLNLVLDVNGKETEIKEEKEIKLVKYSKFVFFPLQD